MNSSREPDSAARDEVMRRVRAALSPVGPPARSESRPAPPEIDEAIVRLASPGPRLVDLFIERAGEAGMKVQRCGPGSLPDTLLSLLQAENVRSLCVSMAPGPVSETVLAAALRAGATVADHEAGSGPSGLFEVDAGVTDVDAAVAESGTIVVRSDGVHDRGAFLVPPVHIAIVSASAVVPDLLDLWLAGAEVLAKEMPTSLVLVTGPSKTADIEGILITGVHGPRVVHVIVLDGV